MITSKRKIDIDDFCFKFANGGSYDEHDMKKAINILYDGREEDLRRKLVVQPIKGAYKDHPNTGVIFSVVGTPPRGQILVLDVRSRGVSGVFYYSRGKIKDLTPYIKYRNLCKWFCLHSKIFLEEIESEKNDDQVKYYD